VLSRINKSAKCTVRITVTSLWGQASLDGGRGSPPPRTAPSSSINVTHTQSPLRLKEPASRFPIHVLHVTPKYDSRPLKWVPAVAESGGSLESDKPPRASPSLYETAVHKANSRKHCLPSFRVLHYNIICIRSPAFGGVPSLDPLKGLWRAGLHWGFPTLGSQTTRHYKSSTRPCSASKGESVLEISTQFPDIFFHNNQIKIIAKKHSLEVVPISVTF